MASLSEAQVRKLMLEHAHADIAKNASRFTYAEDRPIPVDEYKAGRPVTTDCSGWYTCMCFASGAPDPNGYAYTHPVEGSTASLLSHMETISLSQCQPGDAVVYGAYPGKHVAMFLTPGSTTAQLGSFGSQGGPRSITIAAETAAHAGQAVTYKRLRIPPVKRTVWVVRNGKGEILVNATAHPVSWAIAHPRAFRKYGIVTFHREERDA